MFKIAVLALLQSSSPVHGGAVENLLRSIAPSAFKNEDKNALEPALEK